LEACCWKPNLVWVSGQLEEGSEVLAPSERDSVVSICGMHVELDDVQGEMITAKGPQSLPCPMPRLEHAVEGSPSFHGGDGASQTKLSSLPGLHWVGKTDNICRSGNAFADKQNDVVGLLAWEDPQMPRPAAVLLKLDHCCMRSTSISTKN
jgi:hypothetical protein